MPGRRITDYQVRRYMDERRKGATQLVAAAKASARPIALRYDKGGARAGTRLASNFLRGTKAENTNNGRYQHCSQHSVQSHPQPSKAACDFSLAKRTGGGNSVASNAQSESAGLRRADVREI